MQVRIFCCLAVFLPVLTSTTPTWAQVPPSAAADPYRDEPFVFERVEKTVRMHADGTGEMVQHVILRVQSEGTARQFSVLNFPYAAANETGIVDFARVLKKDGTTVETPVVDAMEMPAEVSREAPMYSDVREKHLPVRSLSTGDRLEYQFRTVRTKAEAPNQFWGAEHFITGGGVVLSQTVTLQVPEATYVQVWSPNHPATPTIQGGMRTWRWSASQTKPSQRDSNGRMAAAEVKDPDEDADGRKLPSVAWTTFHTWAEVGDWYRGLALARAEPNDAVHAKADELTRDAKTPQEQVEALYRFVAAQTRYISISLGVGRYQPHSAADVLANQYGDCKDKDTLLESLLHAKGFTTAPALIGAGIVPVADLPTPAVFNHVITTVQLPGAPDRIWLDTTAEVAPFRVLLPVLRDQNALVVPAKEPASLVKTPADPPFPYHEQFNAVATLDKDGLLKSHMQMKIRSDSELGYRIMLQRASPAQWDDAMQYVSNALNFGGKVSNTDMRQADAAGPVQLSWDYTRPDFADWKNNRILPLFPALEVATIGKEKSPDYDISLGAPRTLEAHTTIALPTGYRAELPAPIHVKRPYSTFDQTYRLSEGKLQVDRTVVVLKNKLPKAEWKDYLAFQKSIGMEDGENYIVLIASAKPAGKPSDSSGKDAEGNSAPVSATAMQLLQHAAQAEQRNDLETARKDLDQIAQIDPKTPYLKSMRGALAAHDHKMDEAISDFKSELQDHPDANSGVIVLLAAAYSEQKHYDEAIALLKSYSDRKDKILPATLARIQTQKGDDAGALATMQAYIGDYPDDRAMQSEVANALYRLHKYPEATEAAKKAMDGSDDPGLINNNVYLLSEMKIDLPFAEANSRRSIDLLEKSTAAYAVEEANTKAFADSANLTASWDTLAYILLMQHKPADAEPYFRAAWFNRQDIAVANHLAQTWEALGRKGDALAMNRLALTTEGASNSKDDYAEVKANIARLEKAGVKAVAGNAVAASLQEMRTYHIHKPAGAEGGGTVRTQVGNNGILAATLVTGSASLKPALAQVQQLKMPGAVPAGSPARILRDAVLYCGKSSALCDFVFMTSSGIGREGVSE